MKKVTWRKVKSFHAWLSRTSPEASGRYLRATRALAMVAAEAKLGCGRNLGRSWKRTFGWFYQCPGKPSSGFRREGRAWPGPADLDVGHCWALEGTLWGAPEPNKYVFLGILRSWRRKERKMSQRHSKLSCWPGGSCGQKAVHTVRLSWLTCPFNALWRLGRVTILCQKKVDLDWGCGPWIWERSEGTTQDWLWAADTKHKFLQWGERYLSDLDKILYVKH